MNVTDRFREEWRCPYCDGLNSWENETCRICGDGTSRTGEGTHVGAGGIEWLCLDNPPCGPRALL